MQNDRPWVECHSGSEYAERPIAFFWQGRRYQVAEVTARWRTPDGKHFRVITDGRQGFELFYAEQLDEWRIQEL